MHWKSIGLGAAAGVVGALSAALGRRVATNAKIGHGHPLKHRMLDIASDVIQPKYPLDAMSTYLDGIHFYADDMGRQVAATHVCTHLRHDLHQCVIFDRNAPDARLIGIEYIISRERFLSLPDEEKKLWHSHHYEVSSGLLTAPGVPKPAANAYFEDLVTTYGKTFHTWQYDRDDFPYGIPQLMMGFTDDGQVDDEQVQERDRRLGISAERVREGRAELPIPDVAEGANLWEGGRTLQTRLEEKDFRR